MQSFELETEWMYAQTALLQACQAYDNSALMCIYFEIAIEPEQAALLIFASEAAPALYI